MMAIMATECVRAYGLDCFHLKTGDIWEGDVTKGGRFEHWSFGVSGYERGGDVMEGDVAEVGM